MNTQDQKDKELGQATRKLKALLANLDIMNTFVINYNSDLNNVHQLQTRLEEVSAMTDKFEQYQSEVEILEEKQEEQRIAERTSFTMRLCDTKALIMHVLEQESKKNEEITSPSFSSMSSKKEANLIKLPAIELPKFNGDWQQWTSFIESYNAMFHNNTNLAPVHQFHYLRSCLVGPASEVIKSIPTTGENYLQAYETLINRFENKGAIIQSHIRALLDTPKVMVASTVELQQFHHHVISNINALRALEQPVDSWDAWLVTLICTRLDNTTIGEWHLQYNKKELPKFTTIERFLFNRIAAYEAGEVGSVSVSMKKYLVKPVNNKLFEKKSFVVQQQNEGPTNKCPVCAGDHKIYGCNQFNAMTILERRDAVSKHRLCFNCLSSGHQVKDCKGSSCLKCAKRHNTKLHLIVNNYSNQRENQSNDVSEETEGHNQTVLHIQQQSPKQVATQVVLLATAIVTIVNGNGKKQECRAILDSGSQISLITKKCAQALYLTPQHTKVTITGIGEKETSSRQLHPIMVHSRFNNFEIPVTLHVLPKITDDLPTDVINVNNLNIPSNVVNRLADPQYANPQPVDILLGAEIFFELLQSEKMSIGPTILAQNTRLGWIITGTAQSGKQLSVKAPIMPTAAQVNHLSALSLLSTKVKTQHEEDLRAEEHFVSTHHRDDTGRFVVCFPFSQDPSVLGDSKAMAQRRFMNLEKMFIKDPNFASEYHKFMAEYTALNHMKEVTNNDTSHPVYYLPHHGVLRAESLTTKLRVVFDGSAPARCGQSLNDILIKGPKVQPDLISIVLRFRIHNVVLTADIAKMYRQVRVHHKDCSLQRIYYRTDSSLALKTYQLLTITYGTKAASFLATRCLKEMAKHAKSEAGKRAIEQDFYVDDLITGSDSVEKVFSLYQDVSATLDSAHLPLRKWCSNSTALLNQMPSAKEDPTYLLSLDEDETISALGMKWQPSNDSFRYSFKCWEPPCPMTKRTMLSDIHKIYDPIGLLTPVLIKGKIFMQNLWALKVNWDSKLSSDIQERWIQFYKSLQALEQLIIPRQVLCTGYTHLEMHGFCDASQNAFGACIYIRSLSSNGIFYVKLFSSKSRVAPMHQTTIPRLELCGALLLAELYLLVSNELKQLDIHLESENVYLWTDSSIVLSWINCTFPLKSYVSNRIAQILDITQASSWFHVQTSHNPADLITRGIESNALQNCKLWWNGPKWLSESRSSWPTYVCPPEEGIPELRSIKISLQISEDVSDNYPLSMFSKWNRMVRVTAYMLRFIVNTQQKRKKNLSNQSVNLTAYEIQQAKLLWLRYAQVVAFQPELDSLAKSKMVKSNSRLKLLNPFLDANGLIRVGGRLQYLDAVEERRHPIVLPAKGKIVKMIFNQMHLDLLHIGPQGLLANIQLQYWPLRGRNLARTTYHQCSICFRAQPSTMHPQMAPIPRSRISIQRAFSRTGVDFCGPIMIKSGIRRVKAIKSYISVFVCFTTRAMHLELVSGLSSEAFLAALTRFIARRGPCAHMHSDNGTNFVGANRELQSYFKATAGKSSVVQSMAEKGIEWHFNPPSGPHFGGIWESAVRSAKSHLLKVTNNVLLTFEETSTLLCRIEAILNSRPLTPMADDPSDFEALTPGHFLVGGPILLPPEPDSTSVSQNKLRRFVLVSSQMQWFWKRWSKEYIPQIHKRNKWLKPQRNLSVGDLVIVKEECIPPLKWKLARIVKVHPGKDDIVRVATIRMGNGTEYQRPVVKLALLPTVNDEEDASQS